MPEDPSVAVNDLSAFAVGRDNRTLHVLHVDPEFAIFHDLAAVRIDDAYPHRPRALLGRSRRRASQKEDTRNRDSENGREHATLCENLHFHKQAATLDGCAGGGSNLPQPLLAIQQAIGQAIPHTA
jgi:hypothetical protein